MIRLINYRLLHPLLLIGMLGCIFASCTKEVDDPSQTETVNKKVYQYMKYFYYWNEELPSINPTKYESPGKVLEALRNPLDRWSYMMSRTEYISYFQQGSYIGYGLSFRGDDSANLVVAFVYNDSPLKAKGVERGWKLKSVNGTTISPSVDFTTLFGANSVGVSNEMVFEDLDGKLDTISSSKKEVSINTVLEKKILDTGTEKVGYLAFESFIAPSKDELNDAFSYFNTTGINDLVVDLRYNGGGQMDIAVQLAGLIASDIAGGRNFVNIHYNNILATQYDTSLSIPTGVTSPGLHRVFFIADRGSASASEVVINGLEPWMDVQIVGDSTYGKPMGMNVFDFDPYDYVLIPICFKLSNANNYGDYFDGLPPDAFADDDLRHELGSPEESCFKAVLEYIKTGTYPAVKKSMIKAPDFGISKLHGLKGEHPVF
jgi:carboxyl-terminal processing protease